MKIPDVVVIKDQEFYQMSSIEEMLSPCHRVRGQLDDLKDSDFVND